MLKIMVLDDEAYQIEKITAVLRENFQDIIIDTASSVEELDKKRNLKEYDLYLLDIEVGEESGLDYGKVIRKTNQTSDIIFITSHDEFALEGYDAQPLGYLIKPFLEERLIDLVKKAEKKFKSIFTIKVVENYRSVYIKADEVMAVVVNEGKTEIRLVNDVYELNKSLKKIREEWGPSFIQINRFALVNVVYIKRIDAFSEIKSVTLTDGSEYTFGDSFYSVFHQALLESRDSR